MFERQAPRNPEGEKCDSVEQVILMSDVIDLPLNRWNHNSNAAAAAEAADGERVSVAT